MNETKAHRIISGESVADNASAESRTDDAGSIRESGGVDQGSVHQESVHQESENLGDAQGASVRRAGHELDRSDTLEERRAARRLEKQLVQRSIDGDKEAYRELMERYQGRVYRLAFEVLRHPQDAEDVVQESFVKAYLSLKTFRGHSSFYTWLYRIVYNMAIDYKRRISRKGGDSVEFQESHLNTSSSDSSVLLSSVETPSQVLQRKETAARIQQVLGELSEEHRTVVVLREFDGLSYERISEVLGVSKGTVMSRLHYARKKLQDGLRDLRLTGAARPATDTTSLGTEF